MCIPQTQNNQVLTITVFMFDRSIPGKLESRPYNIWLEKNRLYITITWNKITKRMGEIRSVVPPHSAQKVKEMGSTQYITRPSWQCCSIALCLQVTSRVHSSRHLSRRLWRSRDSTLQKFCRTDRSRTYRSCPSFLSRLLHDNSMTI